MEYNNDEISEKKFAPIMIDKISDEMNNMKLWPKAGSKATFTGTRMFWFANMIKDANDLLEIGKKYTINKIELASSWCAVILDEFPDKKFSLSWFTYDKDLTTEETRKLERDEWETVKYEFTTLKELKERAFKHADEVLDSCTKHSETLKNCKSPKEVVENCDRFENLMKEYEADSEKILKALRSKALLKKWNPVLNPNNVNQTPLSALVLLESEEQKSIQDNV